jgi:hypothetical protein
LNTRGFRTCSRTGSRWSKVIPLQGTRKRFKSCGDRLVFYRLVLEAQRTLRLGLSFCWIDAASLDRAFTFFLEQLGLTRRITESRTRGFWSAQHVEFLQVLSPIILDDKTLFMVARLPIIGSEDQIISPSQFFSSWSCSSAQ